MTKSMLRGLRVHSRLLRARVANCLVLVLLAACQAAEPSRQSGSAAPSGRAAVQEFRFNIGGEPPAMDPQYASWDGSIAILTQLFTPLLSFDERLQVVPAVAREVPSTANGGISSDSKTYTFKLRDDVKWSDGRPLTAKDFEYGVRRLFDPDKGAEYASFYFAIVGAEDYFMAKGT